jgi:hypothetical protein
MVSSLVVSALESHVELDRPPAASSKLDLHAWIAIGCASVFATGIVTLVVVAYSHVP